MIMGAIWLGNVPAFFLLKRYGRRSMLLNVNLFVNLILLVMSIAMIKKWPNV